VLYYRLDPFKVWEHPTRPKSSKQKIVELSDKFGLVWLGLQWGFIIKMSKDNVLMVFWSGFWFGWVCVTLYSQLDHHHAGASRNLLVLNVIIVTVPLPHWNIPLVLWVSFPFHLLFKLTNLVRCDKEKTSLIRCTCKKSIPLCLKNNTIVIRKIHW